MTSVLERFLSRNSINPSHPLPLVHTSDSYLIKKVIKSGTLKHSPCDIFEGEELLYFFVGRAAYKKTLREEPEYWELPSCLVFEYDVSNAQRIFPFDTGAFARRRYPNYISMMDMKEYELTPGPSVSQRAIGAFFGTNKNYYRLKPIGGDTFKQQHDITVDDEEIQALYRLISEKAHKYDDRRFSIEVQFAESFDLSKKKMLLAIIPEAYLSSDEYMRYIYKFTNNIQTYPLYPLRKEYHYFAIYEKLDSFYAGMNSYGL